MLLAVVFMHGGEDDLNLLELLPNEQEHSLRKAAEALLALSGEQRAAAVVQELRRGVEFPDLAGLDGVDPSWLVDELRSERPRTTGIVLSQLSAPLRSAVAARLPEADLVRVPRKQELRGTSAEVVHVVRQCFRSKFVPMPQAPRLPGPFSFANLNLLEGRALLRLVRDLGIDALASALLAVGPRQLAELCTRVDQETADALIEAAKGAPEDVGPTLAEANQLLRHLLTVGRPPAELKADADARYQRTLIDRAGLYQLAKACRREGPRFVRQMAQRLPRNHGRLLEDFVTHQGDSKRIEDGCSLRLRKRIVARIERYDREGALRRPWRPVGVCHALDGDVGDREGASVRQPVGST